MKNNTFFKLFIIILIGLTFRLWFLDKPEGLWNDEYVSWFIASQSDWNTFWQKVYENCHMPLYYFYLKIWMFCFSDTDISLRWSSVLPSILSIPMMYFVGKEVKNNNLGLFCAILTALSSFLIYFGQEVRLYSLVFLITSSIIYYFIKAIKEPSNKNIILFYFSNIVLIITHTLGIIFSFFIIIIFIIHQINKKEIKKKLTIKSLLIVIGSILLSSSLLYTIATSKNLSQFWSEFSITKIVCNFIDYYSPILVNLVSTPKDFLTYFVNNNEINYSFIIFAIIPTIIGLYSLYLSIKEKNEIINYLIISSSLFFITLMILSICGKMILVTKYSIEIYPMLILTSSFGLLSIRKEILKKILIFIFVGLNLFYLCFSNDSAPKRTRPEGHKAIAELLKDTNLNKNDTIVFTYYGVDKFERYIENSKELNTYTINKFNFNYPLFNGENYYSILQNGKINHKDFFTEFPNKKFQKYILNNYISKLKKGDKLGIITLNSVSFISVDKMKEITSDDKKYQDTSFIFLVFSAVKNNLLYAAKQELKFDTMNTYGDWTLHVYIKE